MIPNRIKSKMAVTKITLQVIINSEVSDVSVELYVVASADRLGDVTIGSVACR
jgi:hypothetical protein